MPSGGLLKLHPLDSRHRQPIRIILLYVITYVGELKMTVPSEEKLVCDKFNLEALLSTKSNVSRFWQTGKMFSLEPKREVYFSSTCAPCKMSSDWIRVRVAVTNEILKSESSKCILDPPRVKRRGTRIVTLS